MVRFCVRVVDYFFVGEGGVVFYDQYSHINMHLEILVINFTILKVLT